MSAQPLDPTSRLDTGEFEVIHLGGQAAVVVPIAEFLRLRALERVASQQALEEAEDAAALQDWRARRDAGRVSYLPVDQVRARLGVTGDR